MKRFALFVAIGLAGFALSVAAPAHATTVTELELTGGAVNYNGKYDRTLDRLFAQDGTLLLSQFQAIGELVPSIEGCKTFSLFTSGFAGASAPTATISGSAISVDLSSLFFAASQGDSYKTWNIGEVATGQYNPETREFTISWDHTFDGGKNDGLATFFLQGVAQLGNSPQPVAIPASLVLYATGLLGLGTWTWLQRRTSFSAAA